MSWSDFFVDTDRLVFDVRDQAERERRLRRLADQHQDQQLEALARENAQLGLLLSVVTDLLVEKGLLTAEELRRKVEQLRPPPAPSGENPFAGLQTCGAPELRAA